MTKTVQLQPVVKEIVREELSSYHRRFAQPNLLQINNSKLRYFLTKNLGKIEDLMEKDRKFNEKQLEIRGNMSKEYQEAEIAILEEFCQKDDQGKPMKQGNMYNIPNEKIEDVNSKKETVLSEKFPEEWAKNKTYEETIEEYMIEKISINFHSILESNIPEEVSTAMYMPIRDFVIDDLAEEAK